MGIQITVKDVDEKTFQELKAAAAKAKMPIGSALNMAIHSWLATIAKPKLKFTEWKPIRGPPGT